MKKNVLLSAGLSLFSLCGLLFSSAKAQGTETPDTIPVSLYGLSTTETAPAHPTEGWTEFQLPTRNSDNQLDTLNKLYFRVGAAPVNIEEQYNQETYEPIPMDSSVLTAIGFDFLYGNRKMTHFGLTGNGFIYLGTEKESGKDVKRLLKYRSSISMLNDAIAATPGADAMGWGYPNEPNFIADAQTKIGYYKDEENNYLIISFRDILLGSYISQTYPEPPINYTVRWTYDIILNKDGNITLRFVKSEQPTVAPNALYFTYALFDKDASGIYAADWEGNATAFEAESSTQYIAVSDNTETTVLTYTAPVACVTPTGVTASLGSVESFSTDFSAELAVEGKCDGWVVFTSDNNQVEAKPVDGKTYSAGSWYTDPDEIGGFPVRIAGTETSLSVNELQPASTYYIYAYPYNSHCVGGPLYQQEPVILSVNTTLGGPVVAANQVNENSVQFKFPELADNAKILVGMSRRDYRDESNQQRYIMNSISGKAYKTGDTLYYNPSEESSNYSNHGPYFIEVAHVGTVENKTLSIDNLEAGKPYYFYFWTAVEGENQYAAEYSQSNIHTIATTPFTFTFANDRNPLMSETGYLPAGWSESEGMEASFQAATYSISMVASPKDPDETRSLGARLVSSDMGATSVRVDAITPAFYSSLASFDIRYQVQMQVSGFMGGSLSQLGANDTLTVWYRTADQNAWTLASTITNETTFNYDENDFASLKATVQNVPQDKNIQLRFMVKAEPAAGMMSTKIFLLHNVMVEPHLNCAYPENLAIFDSLTTHKAIGLKWNDINTPVASTIFRYREAGTQTWSAWQSAQQPTACLVRGLNANTAYEVAVQSVCRRDSSLVKTIEGLTLRGVPYTKTLTDLKELPAEMEGMQGALPQDKDEVAETATDNYHQGFSILNHRDTAVGTMFATNMSGYWLNLPTLCLEDMPAPAEFTFGYRAYRFNYETNSISEVDPESPFHVLVLVSKDGAFKRADSVGELTVKNMDTVFKTCTIDLTKYTRQLHIALYVENEDMDYSHSEANMSSFFVVNGVSVRYTGDRPCDPIENIRQYNLTTTGVTIEWDGSAFEYGIAYTDLEAEENDTVYTSENIYSFDNLKPGTAYSYCIFAYCEEGHHSPSAASEPRYFNTRRICEVPTNFAVVGTTTTDVTLTAKSEVEKLVHVWGKSETVKDFQYLNTWAAEYDTLVLQGLSEKQSYYAAVRSVCAAGDSSAWTETLEFTMKDGGVAIEPSTQFEDLKVGSSNGRIIIWNTNAIMVERIEVYNLMGQKLYAKDFRTTDNIWLPTLTGGTRMVLVRILSKGETAVYKIVLK